MVKVVVWSFLQLQGGVASDKLISFPQVLGKLIKMKDDIGRKMTKEKIGRKMIIWDSRGFPVSIDEFDEVYK